MHFFDPYKDYPSLKLKTLNENEKTYLENEFLKYVFVRHCSCVGSDKNSTCLTEGSFAYYKQFAQTLQENNCSQIKLSDEKEDYLNSVNTILDLFVKLKYIYKKSSIMSPVKRRGSLDSLSQRFYISKPGFEKGMKLTWENIKSIDDPKRQGMFWFLRKAIVDCLVKYSLEQTMESKRYLKDIDRIQIFSVGSTKITSDYDLTIYSNPTITVEIIRIFQDTFDLLFSSESSDVFDTNVYGKGFIEFSLNKDHVNEYIYATCGNVSFYHIKQNDVYSDSQLMWSLIKYLSALQESLGEDISHSTIKYLNKNLQKYYDNKDSTHLKVAKRVFDHLNNEEITYETILANENNLKNTEEILDLIRDYKSITNSQDDDIDLAKILRLTDFISLVNFYGVETYYTKGAFMDVVVNGQMCKSHTSVNLSLLDYTNSVIENVSFFLLHNEKTKYLIRIRDTLSVILQKEDTSNEHYDNVKKSLRSISQTIDDLSTKNKEYKQDHICSYIDDLDITKCNKYNIFEILLKLVYYLLQFYLVTRQTTTLFIPFENTNVYTLLSSR